ncbi:heat shock protein HslJ [Povalibacter uvarum]|uniref:Heat shock protein HslJ n=1 Tax=Povalibacter uvarum TaxID=732238 RepID=A0A841HR89_9GAMM|nr:META domain-containing protein [Povalibacter uvarum]MBB6095154.1 heat shock protein HslJ [Povalibacter uvarum]
MKTLPASFVTALMFGMIGCASSPAAVTNEPLEGPQWKLTRLGGQPATATSPEKAPYLQFLAAEKRVVGSGGCNRLGGSYTLDGSKLTLGQMASTMMACPHGMDQEQALHAAFKKVTNWRVDGETLQLLDAAGQSVATFEAKK